MKNLFSLIIGLLIGALITYYFFSPTGMTTPPPLTMPSGIITPTEAKKLSDNWTNLRQQYVDSVAYEAEDNRSSWYSIKDMEYYVNYAKDSLNASGIRLYLGVDTSVGPKGLTTIFLVPTENDKRSGTQKDISTANGLDMGGAGVPPGQGYPN